MGKISKVPPAGRSAPIPAFLTHYVLFWHNQRGASTLVYHNLDVIGEYSVQRYSFGCRARGPIVMALALGLGSRRYVVAHHYNLTHYCPTSQPSLRVAHQEAVAVKRDDNTILAQ